MLSLRCFFPTCNFTIVCGAAKQVTYFILSRMKLSALLFSEPLCYLMVQWKQCVNFFWLKPRLTVLFLILPFGGRVNSHLIVILNSISLISKAHNVSRVSFLSFVLFVSWLSLYRTTTFQTFVTPSCSRENELCQFVIRGSSFHYSSFIIYLLIK